MLQTFQRDWLSNTRGDLLSGLVVALALIPEAIAFSIIAGVDPKVGLYASFCIAVVIAVTGGPWDDLGRHGSNGAIDGDLGQRLWFAIFVSRDSLDWGSTNRRGLFKAR